MPTSKLTVPRGLLWGVVIIALAFAIFAVVRWRQRTPTQSVDPYAAVPFRPRVTYEAQNIIIINTEAEPYFDASVNVYIGGSLYSAQLGTIGPGETKQIPLRSLLNQRGESFDPGRSGISELEVRARFGGYTVHKDFPPPHE